MKNFNLRYFQIIKTLFPISILFLISSMFYSCSGCSHSGLLEEKKIRNNDLNIRTSYSNQGKTIVKMEKINGVYQIPVEVNGVNMFFIFDTGASLISISETEALYLYKQGKLTKEDIKGTASFTNANGDISEGTIIVLATVKIGNRVLKNIEASVVPNLKAPILFGQSGLEKFGKISIDNNRGNITFE